MYHSQSYFPVNWMDGMKMNKDIFIAQDNANNDALFRMASLNISPVRYGVLSTLNENDSNFNVHISLDNQMTIRVAVLACKAVTKGGIIIDIPAASTPTDRDKQPAVSLDFSATSSNTVYWIVLQSNPFQPVPFGEPDSRESPLRLPFVHPGYTVQIISDEQYNQFVNHPQALFIGKLSINGNTIAIDEEYIPPCFSVSAHPGLISLYGEVDSFLSNLENHCSRIIQKMFKRNQQNDLSELVLFLCDRVMLYLGEVITHTRWHSYYDQPAQFLSNLVSLARIMKNTIDLRIGTGKDELMNYLSEWCGLKPGELEKIFTDVAMLRYDNDDINKCLSPITRFVTVANKLFETLSNLEFIGKKKESGYFVKEEQQVDFHNTTNNQKGRRRFFG